MLVTNTETVAGKTIVSNLGLVSGNTIRGRNFGSDFLAGLKNLVGGELKGYTKLLRKSREEALERMIAEAEALGANAVVNVRFSTASVTDEAAEVLAYGTAVRVE